MNKVTAKFDTVAIRAAIDPSGGYSLRLKDRPVYDERQVFEEVVKEKSLPIDKETLEFAFLAVLKTMAQKVSQDCNPRRVGNYLKFYPTLRGKVKGPYSAFDPATCASAIVVSSLSGLEKAVDADYVSFVNARAGLKVTVARVSGIGSDEPNVIQVGGAFAAYGTNLVFKAALGDTVTASWEDEGETRTVALTPTESDYDHMRFAWAAALEAVPAGGELTLTFRTRGGVADADEQVNTKTVRLVAAA